MMNGSRSSGLLHCHYFSYAYLCFCGSHLHTDMSNFHPHEGILDVCIQHLTKPLTKRHEATSGAVHLLACTAASMGDVHIDDLLFAMCVTLWGWDA